MTQNFERNELSRIQSVVNNEQKEVLLGTVKRIFERTEDEDEREYNFLAEVYIDDNEFSSTQVVPIINTGVKSIEVPTVGDRVRIEEDSYGKLSATGKIWTTVQLPPVGRAGMWKKEVESPTTNSLGDNNLFLTGYTNYGSVDPSTEPEEGLEYSPSPDSNAKEFGDKYPEKSDATSSVVQIASHSRDENSDPIDQDNADLKVEVKDSSTEDSYVSVELNKAEGSDSDATWGIKFNIDQGTFTFSDPEGYGFKSNGGGDFQWYQTNITYNDGEKLPNGGL